MKRIFSYFLLAIFIFSACQTKEPKSTEQFRKLVQQYEEVSLRVDLSDLSEEEREVLDLLVSAAEIIDDIFWLQTYGNSRESLLEQLSGEYARKYALVNYGPWSRLAGHTSFYPGFKDKPLGAQFYPVDMSRAEFDVWESTLKSSPYTMIRRNQDNELIAIPYAEAFADQLNEISLILNQAANTIDYENMSHFLRVLAQDLQKDDFSASEYAWMQMKDNNIDLVMRPLDTGEDRKFGYKAAYSTYLVLKDREWSAQLERYSGMTKILLESLPVPEAYKQENPGDDAEIFVYDALYYAGHCNAGPKIIALYLPRDPEVQKQTGTRSMQLKNVMEAKFEHILSPIGEMMIHESQRSYVSSDAFFLLTAFHEIAASLGISLTVDGEGAVSDALREHHNTINATSTDLMALYMISQLAEMGEITQEEFQQAYITSFASVMRSSRFGAAGAHGIAGMIRFNLFEREEVFHRCPETFTYTVDVERMKDAVEKALIELILLQGNSDYKAAGTLIEKDGFMPDYFKADIERINNANIPVDVIFRQGMEYLK